MDKREREFLESMQTGAAIGFVACMNLMLGLVFTEAIVCRDEYFHHSKERVYTAVKATAAPCHPGDVPTQIGIDTLHSVCFALAWCDGVYAPIA